MTIEDQLALALAALARIERKVDEQGAERQHRGGRWGSRAEAARWKGVGLDAIDGMIRRGELRVERIGPEPELRRDRLGRRIDRRRVRVWIDAAPLSDGQVDAAAREARS